MGCSAPWLEINKSAAAETAAQPSQTRKAGAKQHESASAIGNAHEINCG